MLYASYRNPINYHWQSTGTALKIVIIAHHYYIAPGYSTVAKAAHIPFLRSK